VTRSAHVEAAKRRAAARAVALEDFALRCMWSSIPALLLAFCAFLLSSPHCGPFVKLLSLGAGPVLSMAFWAVLLDHLHPVS